MQFLTKPSVWCALGLLSIALAGCDRQEELRTYRVPKEAPVTAPARTVALAGPAPEGHAAAPVSEDVKWTLPAGWKEQPGGSDMRLATLLPNPEDPQFGVTVVRVPPAGKNLQFNINRWEEQVGLKPSKADELGKVIKQVDVNGVPALVIDLAGPPAKPADPPSQRILVAIFDRGADVWFFKLSAADEKVAPHAAKFQELVASVRFVPGTPKAAPAAHGHAGGAGEAASRPAAGGDNPHAGAAMTPKKLASYDTPAGWQKENKANAMRVVSFQVGQGEAAAEMIVTRLNAGNVGSFLDNVNRWRGQVGLEPVAVQKDAGESQPVDIAGEQAAQFDYTGPAAGGKPAKRVVVALSMVGPDIWFFKLLGPAATVERERPAMAAFLKSIKFADAGDAAGGK